MKTHELASFLRALADVLNALPDTEIVAIPDFAHTASSPPNETVPLPIKATTSSKKPSPSVNEIYEILSTLKKQEIVAVAYAADLTISIRGKDSTKDAVRKVRNYLLSNPSAARKVKAALNCHQSAMISQPLSKALGTLLGNRDELSITGR